jgi:hypothetical protein
MRASSARGVSAHVGLGFSYRPRSSSNASFIRSIAGCALFFTLIQLLDDDSTAFHQSAAPDRTNPPVQLRGSLNAGSDAASRLAMKLTLGKSPSVGTYPVWPRRQSGRSRKPLLVSRCNALAEPSRIASRRQWNRLGGGGVRAAGASVRGSWGDRVTHGDGLFSQRSRRHSAPSLEMWVIVRHCVIPGRAGTCCRDVFLPRRAIIGRDRQHGLDRYHSLVRPKPRSELTVF